MAESDKSLEVYYWHHSRMSEVDFVVKKGFRLWQLIQVCKDVHEYGTWERETKALLKAGKQLKCGNLLVLTDNYESEEKVKGKTVKFVPLWKWLLARR